MADERRTTRESLLPLWIAGYPRRPPDVAQHLRARSETLGGERLVLSALSLRTERLDLVELVQAIEMRVTFAQVAPDSIAERCDDDRRLRDQWIDVRARHVGLHVLTFEPRMETLRGREALWILGLRPAVVIHGDMVRVGSVGDVGAENAGVVDDPLFDRLFCSRVRRGSPEAELDAKGLRQLQRSIWK